MDFSLETPGQVKQLPNVRFWPNVEVGAKSTCTYDSFLNMLEPRYLETSLSNSRFKKIIGSSRD